VNLQCCTNAVCLFLKRLYVNGKFPVKMEVHFERTQCMSQAELDTVSQNVKYQGTQGTLHVVCGQGMSITKHIYAMSSD